MVCCGHPNQTELDCSPLPPRFENRAVLKQPVDVGSVKFFTVHFCCGRDIDPTVWVGTRVIPSVRGGKACPLNFYQFPTLPPPTPQTRYEHQSQYLALYTGPLCPCTGTLPT